MEKWKERLQSDIKSKYADIIREIAVANNSNKFRKALRKLIRIAPVSFQTLLKNDLFSRLYDFIIEETKFVFDGSKLGTKCWYAANDRHEIIKCHNCGKEIHRNIKSNCKAKTFWCCSKCQGEDRYMSKKIAKSKFRSGKAYNESKKGTIPKECHIVYADNPIIYDDLMNDRLKAYYEKHKKTFSYWLDRDVELKTYLMEKSYPLNNTELRVETRVKWVIDRMQRLPLCKECGRQIDFIDVKMSHEWPEYCCVECKKKQQGKMSFEWHVKDIYGKMMSSKWTRPVFSLDEFKDINRKTGEFRVTCLKCGGCFDLPMDLNFYARNGKKSYFRCPDCFPIIGKRKMSSEELEIFNFFKNDLNIKNVKRGDRATIYPFELDIHPMREHSDTAVEYNGIFWHSLEKGCSEFHVLNKVKMCEDLGIKLVVIWEDDFLKDKNKWFTFIDEVINDPDAVISKITDNGNKDFFEVDRMIFNKAWNFPGYELIRETDIEHITRNIAGHKQHWTTPTAGKLIYRKCCDQPSK